ncbi:MAG: HAMP domain-containing protein [Deltaproteobacteria bacterium]|nr:HAMP domain-containing protein [Deltaproteobacteria bacterium]
MSLRLKMIFGIGTILFFAVVVYAVIAVWSQVNHLQDLAKREAELIAAVAERAIVRAMREGRSDEVQALLEKIGEEPHLVRVRIVDRQGAVLRSDRAEDVGKVLALGAWPLKESTPEPVWDFETRTVTIFRPIHNRPTCYTCHEGEQPVLGFLNASVTLPTLTSEVIGNVASIVLPAVFTLVTAGALISLFFAFTIGRRIDTLSVTMAQVEAGDLGAKVPEESGDELGRLGRSFNTMVSRFAEAQGQLKDRHAEEIRRAENLASLGKMAAGIAHEINNPLAGMQNCVRTLLKKAGHDAQGIQYLKMLQEGLDRIGRTVRQLLDFAREAKPKTEPTDLVPLLRRCLALLEHDLTSRKISHSLTTVSELPSVLGDSQQLEQLFLNILMNALEAMADGGEISISVGRSKRQAGLFAEVRIRDTGVGIPPDHLARIFDPFFTTKEVGKGTGLGLSVSYGIAKAHGGFIDVQSEVGKGSTFSVVLPVTGESGNDAAAHTPGGR